jgi:hypothetical protein
MATGFFLLEVLAELAVRPLRGWLLTPHNRGGGQRGWRLVSTRQAMVPVRMLSTAFRRHRCTPTVMTTPTI